MKVGKTGMLEELNKMQEMILNQLNHPDSGVRTETLICFLLKSMLESGKKWSEIERNLAEDCREGLMDQLLRDHYAGGHQELPPRRPERGGDLRPGGGDH